jgi:predicted AlkP superfamily phosphohydrolase/phosphomutase/Flp pilus assembly protein TadD
MSKRLAQRVAIIGWDAADWKIIHPLLDRGLLPNLQSIIDRGVMGNLRTLAPPLSPVLWTSIATGKTADQHGILGFVEPDPVLGTLRPVASTARKTKALWNILSESGMRSLVVNWFASHPAEPIQGAVVSNIFRTATHPPGADWPVMPGAVHPESLQETLADLRVTPADLSGDDLVLFIPQLARIDQSRDKRPLALATILAENITTHASATWLMEHERWDLLAVYYDTIDHAGHLFMPYYPPRRESVSEEDFELYRDVIDGVYCFHDLMLGRLIELAGDDTIFVVLSDHGFQSGAMRPEGGLETNVERAMEWHRSYGMLAMSGPGIRHDELVFGAGLLDIAPTVLAMLGLPAGEDMQGRVLAEAFEEPAEAVRIATWDQVDGENGMLAEGNAGDPWEAAAVVQQLIALGYVEPQGEDAAQNLQWARNQQNFTLARVHLGAGRYHLAIPLLEELVRQHPQERAYRLYLAQSLHEAGRLEDCRAVLDPILQDDPDRPVANLLRGNLAVAEGDLERGLEHLLRAERDSRPLPEMRLAMGRVYLALERWEDAERLFRAVLSLDEQNAAAHAGLARALLGRRDPQGAAGAALDAVALHFEDFRSHYLLGAALAQTGNLERAAQAFQTCLKLRPEMTAAREALAAIHSRLA